MRGIETWDTLFEGQSVSVSLIRAMYKLAPKQGPNAVIKRGFAKTLEYVEEDVMLNYDELVQNHGLIAERSCQGSSVVNMSLDYKRYMRSLVSRGENLGRPRISLSPIQTMKSAQEYKIRCVTESV